MPLANASRARALAYVGGRGAGVGALAVMAYALLFLAYAFARSGWTMLGAVNESAGLPGTLLATWASLSVAALAIALLLVPLGALGGLLTAPLIWALGAALNRGHAPARAAAIGAGVCMLIAALLALAAVLGLGPGWTPSLAETVTFWLGLPLAVYIAAGGLASWELNRRLMSATH